MSENTAIDALLPSTGKLVSFTKPLQDAAVCTRKRPPFASVSTRFSILQVSAMIRGHTHVYAIIMVVNTLLDVAYTLGDLRLHECIRHHHGGQHAS